MAGSTVFHGATTKATTEGEHGVKVAQVRRAQYSRVSDTTTEYAFTFLPRALLTAKKRRACHDLASRIP